MHTSFDLPSLKLDSNFCFLSLGAPAARRGSPGADGLVLQPQRPLRAGEQRAGPGAVRVAPRGKHAPLPERVDLDKQPNERMN